MARKGNRKATTSQGGGFPNPGNGAAREEAQDSASVGKWREDGLLLGNAQVQSLLAELEVSKEALRVLTEALITVNTELERRVEVVAAANDGLENVLNSMRIATLFLDRQLRVQRFTPLATEIFPGIESDLGRPLRQISCPFESRQLEHDTQKVLETLEPVEREVKTAAGKWYLQRILPCRTGQEEVQGVVLTLTDLSERKEAVKEQALLAAIVASSHDSIIGKTPAGIITAWSPGAERMYGYSSREALGRHISFLAPPERKAEIEKIMERLRRGERIIDFETERITKAGRRINVSLTISPIVDVEGNVLGASTNARDITLALEAKKALQRAKEAAEQASRTKSEFLANVSHEIRTPMTVTLSALAQVLGGELTEEQRKYLEMAQSASGSLLRRLDEILDFSRIEARALELAREPFDLRRCVREAVEAFDLMAAEKGLQLSWDVARGVPNFVVGDADRLRQVLTNLISNAVKFTERGEVSVAVSPADPVDPVDPARYRILFSVRDTGVGIAKRDLPRLFQTFSQLDTSRIRRFGGVGLGLAISRRLVEMMDGELRVESRRGKGSLFSFSLPLPPCGDPSSRQRVALAAERNTEPQNARILLVEDEPQISEIISALLRRQGWETALAKNGIQALEEWGTGRFDLILMDLAMPMLDGLKVTRAIRIKEKKNGEHIPIIALTAHARREDRKACLEAGMDGFLAKPVAMADLLALIEKHLGRKKTESEGGEG